MQGENRLKQPAFIDFYNLKLQAGIVSKGISQDELKKIQEEEIEQGKLFINFDKPALIQEIRMPTDAEKQKIINFFKNHAPHVTEGTGPWTLGSYEYQHGISWFENDDFFDFMYEYQQIQELVDGYLKDSIETILILWLKRRIEESKYTLRLKNRESQQFVNPAEIEEISLSDYQILYEGSATSGLRFELELGVLFFQIYVNLAQMLEGRISIQRCELENCNNIFYINHQSRKYCLDELCQAKRSAESSKESDNRSRDTIRKRIARAIDEWLEDKEQIKAAELLNEIPNIAKIMRKKNDRVKSLGTYLSGKPMEELLREKGIEPTIKKEGNKNLYCFERIAIP